MVAQGELQAAYQNHDLLESALTSARERGLADCAEAQRAQRYSDVVTAEARGGGSHSKGKANVFAAHAFPALSAQEQEAFLSMPYFNVFDGKSSLQAEAFGPSQAMRE